MISERRNCRLPCAARAGIGIAVTIASPAGAQAKLDKIEVTGSNIKRIEGGSAARHRISASRSARRHRTAMEVIERLSSNSSVGGVNSQGSVGATGRVPERVVAADLAERARWC